MRFSNIAAESEGIRFRSTAPLFYDHLLYFFGLRRRTHPD